jgi:hypothetical protein
MKIIAKSGTRSYILEATSQEINFLAGRGLCQGKFGDERELPYLLGTTFNIVKAFEQIHRNNQRKSEVESLRATLKAILVGLDMIEPLIEEPNPPEEKPAEETV